jgi:hypothetical protein
VGLLSPRRPDVQKLRRKDNLEGLRAALRYRETFVDEEGGESDAGVEVRVEAAEAMSHFNGPAVADDLAEAVDDSQLEVRLAAVDAISKLGVPTAVERLVDCVIGRGTASDELQDRALELLTGWRLEGVAEFFVERLFQPDSPPVEDRHVESFDRILAADPRGAAAQPPVAEAVIAVLERSPDERAQAGAEWLLGRLGPPAVEAVLEALSDGRAHPALLRAAGLLGDVRAVEPLVGRLDSADPEIRQAAAVAVGSLSHTAAVPALVDATQDPERSVRDAAIAALDRMGTAAVIVGLVTVFGGPGVRQLLPGAGEVPVQDAADMSTEVVSPSPEPADIAGEVVASPAQPFESTPAPSPMPPAQGREEIVPPAPQAPEAPVAPPPAAPDQAPEEAAPPPSPPQSAEASMPLGPPPPEPAPSPAPPRNGGVLDRLFRRSKR